ncbi:MAG: DUF5305 family protein [Desulfitobacterium sp.]
MRKIQLRKDLKLAIIIICVALIGVLATLSFLQYKNPGVEEKKVPLYSYESKGNINYQVFLKPNSLYDTKSLGEEQVYLANLVDYVDTVYNYEFNGEREAEIKGSYEIITVVEGYTGEGDKLTTLWKKQFPLIAKTNFEAKDKKYSITKNIPLKLSDYNAFAERIKEESKVITQAKITTFMNVELTAKTDKGVIEKKASSSLEAPLNAGYFKIIKVQSEGKPEAIEEIQSVPLPLNKNLLIGYGIGIGVLLIALFVLSFGTQKAEIDPFSKELKKIFKKHGTRLVALESEIAATIEQQSRVRSIEDLVRISDELGKPIIYKYSDNSKESLRFWVIDDQRYYLFDVKEMIGPSLSLKEKVRISAARKNAENLIMTENSEKEIATTSSLDHKISNESKEPTVLTWQNV